MAGIYARAWLVNDPRRHVFTGFILATLTGNLRVCLALDAASFYFAFALMTFAAYGLVAHVADVADVGARRAGRVYLVMALLGEALLLVKAQLIAALSGLPPPRPGFWPWPPWVPRC